jgi:hypothetical protein
MHACEWRPQAARAMGRRRLWQERRDSNPQPPVLETDDIARQRETKTDNLKAKTSTISLHFAERPIVSRIQG